MQTTINKDTHLWKMRLAMTQQMLFDGLTKMANNSPSLELKEIMRKSWYSGLDYNLMRMLPDGQQVPGAPTETDLKMRDAIVAEVLDGLKCRPRNGETIGRSLFVFAGLAEYELALAMCQVYMTIIGFLLMDEIDPYHASACETTVYTLLHVAGADEPQVNLYKPLDEGEMLSCPL